MTKEELEKYLKQYKSIKIIKDIFGFIPTTEQWEKLAKLEPGALKLLLAVLDKEYYSKNKKKEKY